MFSAETKLLLSDVLELFAQAYRIPIALYELDEKGNVLETIRANENLFPLHCHKIWELNQGHGRDACNADMCKRARLAIDSRRSAERLCHAGLSNLTEPVEAEGKAFAAIQYGAYVRQDILQDGESHRLHEIAMRKLNATEAEAKEIESLLVHGTQERTPQQLLFLRQTLSPILKRIISQYILQKEREYKTQQAAYHDMQMKMQDILARTENLQIEFPKDSSHRLKFEEILGSAEAGAAVMHSLSRGEYLPQTYIFKPHAINRFIEDAILVCRAEAQKKEIEFVLDLQPRDGHLTIQASSDHLQQAFNNLLQNAVKYSYRTTKQSDKRYIKIRGRVVQKGYELRISNYGVGIEEAEYNLIFQEGYQGRLTRAEYRSGSGRGLPLTKRIIEKHNGSITPISEAQGALQEDGTQPYLTRVTVWLPLKQTKRGASQPDA